MCVKFSTTLNVQHSKLGGQFDTANLRQRYANFSVVFARWQHRIQFDDGRSFSLFVDAKESFNPIVDPDADPIRIASKIQSFLSWAKSNLL